MTAGNKRGIGIAFAVIGAGNAALGLIFSLTDNIALGLPLLGSGLGCVVIGIAILRKG
jgi:hypothetical protein